MRFPNGKPTANQSVNKMQLQGTVDFAARQTAVWHSLTTPSIVSQCTPRLTGWSELAEHSQFQLQFAWGNGSSAITIPLLLTWQEVTPPTLLQWRGEAKMGSTLIPVEGTFQLTAPTMEMTTLAFTAVLDPPNKLLKQMLQTTAPRFIDSFFSCLKITVETV